MSGSNVDVGRACAWCCEPAITKTESGFRACWLHAALDAVRVEQLADSKARMDADQAEIVSNHVVADAIRVGSMKPADVTAAPSRVVAEVLRDPGTFLDAAAGAAPGWSVRYGGPEGVAQITIVLHDHLAELTKRNADLRTSTLIYLRTQANLSLAKLGELLGMSRPRVSLASRRASDAGETSARPFAHLESGDGWAT